MKKIIRTIEFITLLHHFQNIYRNAPVMNRSEMETDAEHSYQLAMIGWYLCSHLKLKFNLKKVIQYALVHDLVEIYAGDTDPHNSSITYKNSKAQRELAALNKIQVEWPDFKDISKLILNYEKLSDKESNLIYLLDKTLPVINTHLANHPYYKTSKVNFNTYDLWLKSKEIKLTQKLPPEIDSFLDELRKYLKLHSKEIFYQE